MIRKRLRKTCHEGRRIRVWNRVAYGIDYQFRLGTEVDAKVHLWQRKWPLNNGNRYRDP